jgi:hypothetical protein
MQRLFLSRNIETQRTRVGMVDALRAAGHDALRYTRYETAPPLVTRAGDRPGHGSYERAYATPELWGWLLCQRRAASSSGAGAVQP